MLQNHELKDYSIARPLEGFLYGILLAGGMTALTRA